MQGGRTTRPGPSRRRAEVSFATIGDVELFFSDDNAGDPPMLFVHGYTCDSHDWSWQLPHFGATHRTIAVDLRGHGRSSAPEAGYTPIQFAADIAGLLRTLDCGPVVVMGHSLGGLVVSVLAVEHPDLVRALIAVDPGYLVADEVAGGIAPFVEQMDSSDPVPLVQAILGGAYAPASPPFLRTWHLRRIAGVPHHVLRQTLAHMADGGEASSLRSSSELYLRRRTCPVLSFYTDQSRVPVEEALFADGRSRSISWPGSGHWLHQERPAEFNAVVDGWLAGL